MNASRSAELTSNANLDEIPLQPVDAEDVVEGRPLAGSVELAAERGVEVGLWEITAGVVVDVEVDEVFVVLSGHGQLMFEDGSFVTLAAGSIVQLRAGERTTWTITEALRKVYIVLPTATTADDHD